MSKKNKEKKPKVKKTLGQRILCILNLLATIAAVLLASVGTFVHRTYNWAAATWDNLTIQEIMYHLNTTMEGSAAEIVRDFVLKCIVVTIVVAAILVVLFIFLRKKNLLTHLIQIGAAAIGVVVIMSTVVNFLYSYEVLDFVQRQVSVSSFIDDNYVSPEQTNLVFPEQKRNLVYIFLESMEMTYADETNKGALPQNIIPELTDLALENECFSGEEGGLNGGVALSGNTWTMGALFGQTSGLPLNLPISGNDMNTQESFFPSMTAIGDVLEKEGYNQEFIIGSDATFGGRDLYFKEHGNYYLYDYYTAIQNGKIPEDYFVWWGYEDAKLFEYAKEEMTTIAAQDKPFNFSLLTVDTHFEDGYVCDQCPTTFGDNQYANVMACNSAQVAEFVSWIQQQPFYENTTIVLCGDHLTMDSDFCKELPSDYQRRTFTTVINAPIQPELNTYRSYSTMDMFPTTLAALGVRIDGDRLGLGTNLYSSEPTLLERYSVGEVNTGLNERSDIMDNLLEGIDTNLANCSIGTYDSTSKTIHVKAQDIIYDDLREVKIQINPVGDNVHVWYYPMDKVGDNAYAVDIPMSDYSKNGDYNIKVQAVRTNSNNDKGINMAAATVNVYDESFENADPIVQSTTTGGNVAVEDYDPLTGGFNIYATDVSAPNGIAEIRAAVWCKTDQSDLRWYPMSSVDDNIYLARAMYTDFENHGEAYQVHVYLTDLLGESTLLDNQEGYFYRFWEEPPVELPATPTPTPVPSTAPVAGQ